MTPGAFKDAGAARPPGVPASPVSAGVVCARCDYDMRGQSLDGACSECGLPVRDSVLADADTYAQVRWLQNATLAWLLQSIFAGATLLIFCFCMAPITVTTYTGLQLWCAIALARPPRADKDGLPETDWAITLFSVLALLVVFAVGGAVAIAVNFSTNTSDLMWLASAGVGVGVACHAIALFLQARAFSRAFTMVERYFLPPFRPPGGYIQAIGVNLVALNAIVVGLVGALVPSVRDDLATSAWPMSLVGIGFLVWSIDAIRLSIMLIKPRRRLSRLIDNARRSNLRAASPGL